MFKKPFNRKIGETRECKGCGISFHTLKPMYTCNQCINAKQKKYETIRREKYPKKPHYPFDNKTNEAGSRFCSIRTKLSNAWKKYKKTGDKSIITEHYNNQLKEIQENGIMQWINDRRDMETLKEKKAKTLSRTRKEYPNHHDYYEY
jgi:hypothetical protein